jgi:hypothetical protein
MNNQNKEMAVTPIEAISYCQNKLGNIPLGNIPATLAQCSAIIQPINEVVVILEKVKQALTTQAPQPEAQPEPEKPAPKRKQTQKVVPLPKAEA